MLLKLIWLTFGHLQVGLKMLQELSKIKRKKIQIRLNLFLIILFCISSVVFVVVGKVQQYIAKHCH